MTRELDLERCISDECRILRDVLRTSRDIDIIQACKDQLLDIINKETDDFFCSVELFDCSIIFRNSEDEGDSLIIHLR